MPKQKKLILNKEFKAHAKVNNKMLTKFCNDIRPYHVMSQEETTSLFRQYHNGNESERKEAFEKICKHNLRLVISVANHLCVNDDCINDLIQEGNIGLVKAIEMFDEENGATFHAYAMYWIRKEIVTYKTTMSARVAQTNRSKTVFALSKVESKLTSELDRIPTDEELFEEYNRMYPKKKIGSKDDIVNIEYLYIDGIDSDTDTVKQSAGLVHEYNNGTCYINDYISTIETDYNNETVTNLMSCLNNREKYIISELYGINGHEEKSVSYISSELGISQQRVRQICVKAMEKMKEKASPSKKTIHD